MAHRRRRGLLGGDALKSAKRGPMSATFQTVRLAPGRHAIPDQGVCVMELASMLAGEPLTDRPRSVSPALANLLRGYNDGLDDRRRQTLKLYAAASLDTARGRAVERQRRRMVRAWLGAIAALDLQNAGRGVATRVRLGDSDALHAEMLGFLDA